jgi:tRNA(fMet)-specific endonuclease VapC
LIEAYLEGVVAQSLDILPYNRAAAEWHAGQRARLATAGNPAPYVAGQITAIAKVNRLTLVTRNVHDFSMFSGLDVQNWHESSNRFSINHQASSLHRNRALRASY